jgi:outer membrane protein OmpA-like peptidoglycan-associated protein
VSDRPAIVRVHETPAAKPRIGRWLLLAAAVVAAVALLVRRGARHEVTNVQRTTQTETLTNVPRPQALQAGSMGLLSQALTAGQALPQRFVLSDLTFRTDSAEIDPASAHVLDDVAQVMAAHPGARIRVEGYTDNTGTREANRQLSQARAESTRAYLASKGISGDHIEAAGYGSDRPLASNDQAGGRADNRRTEIVVLSR